MKRIVILLVAALAVSFATYADEAVVIDFNKLVADYPADKATQNQATIVDFSIAAGSSFTDAEKAQMKTSLAIANWEVILNSSAASIGNLKDSYTSAASVKSTAVKYAGEKIMGIRVFFPTEAWNAVAEIRPPFELPAYMDKATVGADGKLTTAQEEIGKGTKFDGFGVVKNVGVLKSVSVNVRGLNFPHRLSAILKDQNGIESEYVMGYLNFDGWKTLTWENANYVRDVRDRELKVYPLYPNSAPYLKLSHFKIYKDASMVGGDFIGYIKDLSVVFDKAVLTIERDIDDEGTWGILQSREEARRNAELRRLGNIQVLRYLEERKMDDPAARAAAPAAAN